MLEIKEQIVATPAPQVKEQNVVMLAPQIKEQIVAMPVQRADCVFPCAADQRQDGGFPCACDQRGSWRKMLSLCLLSPPRLESEKISWQPLCHRLRGRCGRCSCHALGARESHASEGRGCASGDAVEEIVEVVRLASQQQSVWRRVQGDSAGAGVGTRRVEQIVAAPQILAQSAQVMMEIRQERVSERVVEQIVAVPQIQDCLLRGFALKTAVSSVCTC